MAFCNVRVKEKQVCLGCITKYCSFFSRVQRRILECTFAGKVTQRYCQVSWHQSEILGESRLGGLKSMIRSEVKNGNGYLSAENRIKYLEM